MNERHLRSQLVIAALLIVVATAAPADAAHIFTWATNSGTDVVSPFDNNQPPTLTSGAKGFLIAIDTDDQLNFPEILSVHLTFYGVVNFLTAAPDDGSQSAYPKILTQTEAQTNADGVDYRREDSYVFNQPQEEGGVVTTLSPIGAGFVEEANTLTINGSFGLPAGVPAQHYIVAYIVTTDDVGIDPNGVLTRGSESFNPVGSQPGDPHYGEPITLFYDNASIVQFDFSVPEPSSFALAGLVFSGVLFARYLSKMPRRLYGF